MIKNEILLTNENYITFVNTKNKSKKISHEWYANYEKLKKYVNDENVIEFKHKQDPQLYYWILKEKHDSKNGLMCKQKKILLQQLGFMFNYKKYYLKQEQKWNETYQKLQKYIKIENKLPTLNTDNFLYNWIRRQKKTHAKGTLKQKRKMLLFKLGIINL